MKHRLAIDLKELSAFSAILKHWRTVEDFKQEVEVNFTVVCRMLQWG